MNLVHRPWLAALPQRRRETQRPTSWLQENPTPKSRTGKTINPFSFRLVVQIRVKWRFLWLSVCLLNLSLRLDRSHISSPPYLYIAWRAFHREIKRKERTEAGLKNEDSANHGFVLIDNPLFLMFTHSFPSHFTYLCRSQMVPYSHTQKYQKMS